MDKRRLPKALEDSIRAHKCVPFVGSGLSMPLGIPDWETALKKLVRRCQEENRSDWDEAEALVRARKYLDAAQKCRKLLGNRIYGDEMRGLFGRYDREKSRENHRQIWNLSPPIVITTNFDTILEDSADPRPTVITSRHRPELLKVLTDDSRSKVLFKIHGSIDDLGSIVFTQEDYDRLYQERNAYTVTLEDVVLRHQFLFIGFGLKDEGVAGVLKAVNRLFQGWPGPHYALVKYGENKEQELWDEYNIQQIPYDEHSDVEGILAHGVNLLRESRVGDAAPSGNIAGSTKISLPNSMSGRTELKGIADRCIDECIIASLGPFDATAGRLAGWKEGEIFLQPELRFFRPAGILAEMTKNVAHHFREQARFNSPRFSLDEFRVEPMDSFSRGALSLRSRITDWSLVHGIQDILRRGQGHSWKDLDDCFWSSVSSAVSEGICASFPHHLAIHCLMISSDSRVILNKRRVAFNQRGRISASFEEQMQFPYIFPAKGVHPERLFDGDESPFAAASRGIREEFNLEIDESQFTFLALAFEASSVAANLLCVVKTPETAQEIHKKWTTAEDRTENLMIAPDLLPVWNTACLKHFMANERIYTDDRLYKGRWHASSIARILLGLLWDFGVSEVQQHVDINRLLAL